MGTLIPKTGSSYIYLYEAFSGRHKFFGPLPAFLNSWIGTFITGPSASAIVSLTCANYILFPFFDDGCNTVPEAIHKMLAVTIIRKYGKYICNIPKQLVIIM